MNGKGLISRAFFGVFVVLFAIVSGTSCSTAKKAPTRVRVAAETPEDKAKLAADQTTEDERQAVLIQAEMNAFFFQEKKRNPEGLNAFSGDRIQALEDFLQGSKHPSIRYFIENRGYFDQNEDPGGGFWVTANGKRLLPHLKTKAGRRKLFQMDAKRVREMVKNPCFAALEECGEYASDGEENTALLTEWAKKYPEKEFESERVKLVEEYLEAFGRYEKKYGISASVRPTKAKPKTKGAKETREEKARRILGEHRKRITALKK